MEGRLEMYESRSADAGVDSPRMADGGTPVAGEAMPQAGPPVRGRKLLWAIAALALVAALVLVVVLVAFMGGGSSPEKAFEDFVDGINERYGGKMLNSTILRFAPEYEQLLQDVLNDSMEESNITINSLKTLGDEDLTPDQKDDAEDLMALVETGFDIDVQDYRYVRYNITQTFPTDDGERIEYESDDMLCFEVDSKWYVVLEYYFEEY